MFDKGKYDELKVKMKYKPTQSKLYMSNKYFRIIKQLVKDNLLKRNHTHYTFSYLYLINYLFRYTKYEDVVLSAKGIKELLQYSTTNKQVDYITKKNGLLDIHGLTSTLYDFPLVHQVVDSELSFSMLSEFNDGKSRYGTKWREVNGVNFNSSCKYPVLSFYNNINQYEQEGIVFVNRGGSYFNTEDTTMIPFEVFMYCMSHNDLGTVGFYLYCYITYKNQIEGNCQISIENLAVKTEISPSSLQNYLNTLRKYNLVHTIVADMYVFGKSRKFVEVDANNHFTNEYSEFLYHNQVLPLEKPNYVHISRA